MLFSHNVGKLGPLFKFIYCLIFKETFYICAKEFHLLLTTLLHYLVKCKLWYFKMQSALFLFSIIIKC